MKKKKWIIIAGVVVVIAVIAAAGTSGSDEAQTPQAEEHVKTETKAPEQKEDFTLEGETQGAYDEYEMSYSITGSIKNNTDRDASYVQVTFNLYDAQGNQIGTALDNINNLEAGGIWKFDALGLEEGIASYRLVEISGF